MTRKFNDGKIGTPMILEPKVETYLVCVQTRCSFCKKFKRIKGRSAPIFYCDEVCRKQGQKIKNKIRADKEFRVSRIKKEIEEREMLLSNERFNSLVIGDILK